MRSLLTPPSFYNWLRRDRCSNETIARPKQLNTPIAPSAIKHFIKRQNLFIYDALIAQAAVKAEVNTLLTLNPDHFTRLGEDIARLVQVPHSGV